MKKLIKQINKSITHLIRRFKEIPMKLVSSSDRWTGTMAFTKDNGRKQSFQQHTSTCQIILSNKKAIYEIFYYASSQKKKKKKKKLIQMEEQWHV